MAHVCTEMDMPPTMGRSRITRRVVQLLLLTPYAAMGPVSGPLAYGMVQSIRKGRPVRAGLYLAGVVATTLGLPVLVAKLAPGVLY